MTATPMPETFDAPRIVFPTIPAYDPRFKWTSGADVQKTWKRFGWVKTTRRKQHGR